MRAVERRRPHAANFVGLPARRDLAAQSCNDLFSLEDGEIGPVLLLTTDVDEIAVDACDELAHLNVAGECSV